jgi:LmbE family N-acetylglucosaminyl deacetylase
MRKYLLLLPLLAVVATLAPEAQHRLQPVTTMAGRPALELALRKLDVVGSLMMTTAHPDDENNGLLAYYGHTRGYRASLVTATRGEGGQNEIGPELFEALAVLRTEELLAAHRFDGAEQYFTRAVDFGYSFSVEETLEKWGEEEILGDFVRMIRTIRPDVIVGFVFDGEGGGQHHQTSSRLTLAAFRAAADSSRFPGQIHDEGLRPWQAKKFYYTAGFGFGPPGARSEGPRFSGAGASRALTFTGGDVYDPVLGRTCNEIGGEARSMHMCQGMSQLLPVPQGQAGGPGGVRAYRLRDTVLPDGVERTETEMFDGVDTRLVSLAPRFAGPTAPAALVQGLEGIAARVAEARTALAGGTSQDAIAPLAAGLRQVRALRAALGSFGLGDDARFEIDFRLAQKESQFADALRLAADVRLEVLAADGLVVRGQAVPVQMLIGNRGTTPVTVGASLDGFASMDGRCEAAEMAGGATRACRATATIPSDARWTAAHFRYEPVAARFEMDSDVPHGLPFRPTPFTATFTMTVGGEMFPVTLPVQHRTEGNIFSGEKRAELHVVPAFAVSVSPELAIVPLAASQAPREVRVTVTNHAPGAASGEVRLELPAGWRSVPAVAPVTFAREDEARTVRFALTPPVGIAAGRVTVKAAVHDGSQRFDHGYQVVEYPHTSRRHVLRAPEVTMNALDVRVRPNLTIGYVMGVGDEIPPALEQIGARVELLTADQLAWGDLGHFDVVMTGVRAYERRADLRAHNQRLIDYARRGGTVIVHYNKFEFNEAQYGPFPAEVGRDRVTDEHSPVNILVPDHPVFNTPNRITDADWQNWRQERGLYFLGKRDERYVDLVEFVEPFPYNQGPKRGALVEARVGEGRWIYLGVGLWRQLPAGTDGAYRLMANLISLGQAPGPERTTLAGQ